MSSDPCCAASLADKADLAAQHHTSSIFEKAAHCGGIHNGHRAVSFSRQKFCFARQWLRHKTEIGRFDMTGQLSTSLRKGLNDCRCKIGACSCWRSGMLSRLGSFPIGETNLPGMSAREAAEISAYPAAAARVLAAVLALLAISGVYRLVRVEKWLDPYQRRLHRLAPWVFGATGGEHALAVANEGRCRLIWCVLFRSQKKRSRR